MVGIIGVSEKIRGVRRKIPAWAGLMFSGRDTRKNMKQSAPTVAQGVKDLALLQPWHRSQLWLGFHPWPRNIYMLLVQQEKERKEERKKGRKKERRKVGVFLVCCLFFVFVFVLLCRATPSAYGGSQARG